MCHTYLLVTNFSFVLRFEILHLVPWDAHVTRRDIEVTRLSRLLPRDRYKNVEIYEKAFECSATCHDYYEYTA